MQVSCRSEQTCRTSCLSTSRILCHGGEPIWTSLTVKTGKNCPNYRDFCSDRKFWPRTYPNLNPQHPQVHKGSGPRRPPKESKGLSAPNPPCLARCPACALQLGLWSRSRTGCCSISTRSGAPPRGGGHTGLRARARPAELLTRSSCPSWPCMHAGS